MSALDDLKTRIDEAIYQNTQQKITGEVLQDTLEDMVDTMGVSVSQNTSTGHTDLNIGDNSYPVPSIANLNQVNKKTGTEYKVNAECNNEQNKNKYVKADGTVGDSSSWSISDSIELKKGDTITYYANGSGIPAIAIVNPEGASTPYNSLANFDVSGVTTYIATAPCTIVVNIPTAGGIISVQYAEVYESIEDAETIKESVAVESNKVEQIIAMTSKNQRFDYVPIVKWNSGFINSSGEVKPSSSWQYSSPIFLKKGETVKLTTDGSGVTAIAETNAEGTSYARISAVTSGTTYYEYTATVDKYVAVAYHVGYANNSVLVSPILEINGLAINDALRETCASDCQIAYDDTTGLVAITYSAGWMIYGESWDKGVLAIFPISNPNMVKFVKYAEVGETYTIKRPWDDGTEEYDIDSTSKLSICMNVIALGNGIFRIIYCLRSAWVYRDYNYNTDTLGEILFIEVNYDGTSRKCSWDKFTTFLESIGLSNDDSHKQVYLTSQIMPKDANNRVYITFSGNNSYPILCYMNIDNDNMVLTPFAAYPYYSGYEAAFVKNGNTISLISRNANDTPKGYSMAKSEDNGTTWAVVETLSTGDNNRPRIISDGSNIIVAYGVNVNSNNRHSIILRYGVDVSDLKIIITLTEPFGLSLFSLLIVRQHLYVAWSDGQANMGMQYGPTSADRNKDCVKFSMIMPLQID